MIYGIALNFQGYKFLQIVTLLKFAPCVHHKNNILWSCHANLAGLSNMHYSITLLSVELKAFSKVMLN